jgi:thiol-disulfide isomerase/thioredoxin
MSIGRYLPLLLLLLVGRWAGAATPTEDAFWFGETADGAPSVQLYYFYSPTCPHCQAAKPFLDSLPERFPWIEVQRFSVKDNRINARFYYETAKALGVEALSVPGFAFCRQVLIGYDTAETTGAEISAGRPAGTTLHLPIIGTIDAQALSLPVMTVMLAGVDAFNPCAFFVLLFLLSLLVHAKSRARMLVIGGTFVLFSGIIYFVFMAAWLNVFLIAGELRVITAIAGLVALTIGALNIKDFFLFKQGPSLSIPESAKPGLFKRMREIVSTGNMLPMFASTVVLAIVANSYELLCTAGFPMVYTRTLTLADLEPWQYYAWLAAYNVIYVLPLLAIVLVFTYTMGSRKLAESEGRALKLVSGCMMFGFGLLLLVAPNLLTNALASIAVLAVAVGVALLTAMLARPKPA